MRTGGAATESKKGRFIRKYAHERIPAAPPRKLDDFLQSRDSIAYDLMLSGRTCLEIGCGLGGLSRSASKKYDFVLASDLMIERLLVAKALDPQSEVQYLVADMDMAIPLKEGTVSCVASIATFEYAMDPYSFIDEVYRVLEPGGVFVFQVSNLVWLPRRMKLLLGRLPATFALSLTQDRVWNGGAFHSYTLEAITRLLVDCGLEIVTVRSSGRFTTLGNLWPSLFSPDLILLCKKMERIA